MGRFADIAAGTLARKRGVECTTLSGQPFTCDLRVLNATEEALCVVEACKAARASGAVEPIEDDLIYQLEFSRQAIALAAIDPENEAPAPFFKNAAEVGSGLDRDRILLLGGIHRRFQEAVSPALHDMSDADFVEMIFADATAKEGDELPFERLPPFMRRSYVRRMAVLLSISPEDKSSSTPDSEPTQRH